MVRKPKPMSLNQLKDKALKFSDKTFGKGRSPSAPIHHLKEEVLELIECFEDGKDPLDEFADCTLLLIDAFRMAYGDNVDMGKLINACSDKLDVCETRKWGTPDENGVVKHIKEPIIDYDKVIIRPPILIKEFPI